MKETRILLNDDLKKAALKDLKTQTRRLISYWACKYCGEGVDGPHS